MNLELSSSKGLHESEMFAIQAVNRPVNPADFYRFGELLAYAYYFGIQDLHKDNLLLTDGGIQVIDVEQAFSELLLPNHSLLLPLKKTVNWSSGLNVLTSLQIEELGTNEAKCLIDGFVNMTQIFLCKLMGILDVLQNHLINFEAQPIRVFFRGTRDYVEHIKGITSIDNLFPEEEVQIDRKDVPYFFMFLGNENVYYYSTESWDFKTVEVPTQFVPFINYCALNPLNFMTQRKIEEQWAKGMLYLARKLKSLNSGHLQWEYCSILKSSQELAFRSPSLSMTAKV